MTSSPSELATSANQLFAGQGEMAQRMRSHDWARTSLGPVSTWSQSLKAAVRIMLTSSQPMWVWWGEELLNLYNDAYIPIMGGKHPALFARPGAEVWHEIWDEVNSRIQYALKYNEGTYDESLLFIMERNGYPEETYYTFSYSPIPDDHGNPAGIICANTDDTQRIIGERQLALLRELAARTADARTFDDACTLSATCLTTNLHDLPFALIYLVDPDQRRVVLAGTSGIDRSHPAVPEIVDLVTDQAWSMAEVVRTQQLRLISDLSTVANLPQGAWQRSPDQAVVVPIASAGATGRSGLLVAGLNPFRLFDDNYRRFIDLVAGQIAASIANANAYEEERKRAENLAELDRAKTLFFTNISHEFRTPLTLMLSPIEDLSTTLAEQLQPDQKEQLALVQRNGYRLQKLVNTLLDFSRIEAGRIQAVYEPIDLATYTTELASAFRSLLDQAGLKLIVDCPPLPELVYVDREMWEKIVLNLLSNAFKFTLTGAITVRLQWLRSQVELSIIDTGIGIPAADLPHLFERFHRVENTEGRSFEGSGIGLSLVQELVKLHHGTIHVSSQVGQGSCFTVSLPTGFSHLPADRIGAPRSIASTALGVLSYVEEAERWLPEEIRQKDRQNQRARDRGEVGIQGEALVGHLSGDRPALAALPTSTRILLADDNADMRDYIRRLLSTSYQVETVADGRAALAAIQDDAPDLVLSDVMMPRMDGFELLRTLRSQAATQDIPIILLSARAGEEARIEGLAAGADDYLIKPFSARELMARVEATLKLAQLRRTAREREQILQSETAAVRANLERILSSLREGFLTFDRHWNYTYINDRQLEIIGKSREEVLGNNVWQLFPDVVGTEIYHQFHRAMTDKITVEFEVYYPPLEGWFAHRVYPTEEGIAVFVVDVSDRVQLELERQRTERALRESEARFRNMADRAPMMVWVTDPTGYCTYLSQTWYNFSGQTPETGLGFGWLDTTHPEDYEPSKRQFLAANARQVPFQIEYRMRRQDGEYRWVIDAASPWFDAEGSFKGYIGSVIDISDRKQAEAEREQLLQREQTAREQAETANRIKDEFLAVLSHELRTPMNPILGWSTMLRQHQLSPEKMSQAIDIIDRNAKLQVQLIDDLLDISRILRGKLVLNTAPVDLNFTVNAALETVRLAMEAKSIALTTQLDPTLPTLVGDAGRLQQVVWNLLSNAIKFTPSGGQITVRLRQVGSTAEIQIQDTGKGIHPDFLPYVFEHFRQEDAATTRKFGGLGLGLAIARQIVELHGGRITASSTGEGQGATFSVHLPLSRSSDRDRSATLGRSQTDHSDPTQPLAGCHILAIDDEVDSLDLIVFILEQAGATVTSVSSGLAAWQILEQTIADSTLPDLIVSDIGMPEMDGYMLMRQVRSVESMQAIPAIALTAYVGELDQQQAIAAGFQQHLAKPIEPDTLIEAIARLLRSTLSPVDGMV